MPSHIEAGSRRPGVTRRAILIPLLGCLLTAAAWATPASAHRRESGGNPGKGLAIAPLAHGDMAVFAAHRPRIMALADRQVRTDESFRRLLNYARIQHVYCLWGLVPGAITDEDSSFNECSHAYLAAAGALLDHLQAMPGAHREAAAIAAAIDRDRLQSPNVALCQYSGQSFYTGDVVAPDWADLAGRPQTLALALGFLLTGIGAGWMTARRAADVS